MLKWDAVPVLDAGKWSWMSSSASGISRRKAAELRVESGVTCRCVTLARAGVKPIPPAVWSFNTRTANAALAGYLIFGGRPLRLPYHQSRQSPAGSQAEHSEVIHVPFIKCGLAPWHSGKLLLRLRISTRVRLETTPATAAPAA